VFIRTIFLKPDFVLSICNNIKRGELKSFEIKTESVISKDKNLEFVSVWYKEIWEDAKGKKDSLFQMDDLQMKHGKIIDIDEKSRKYPAKKS
jgi:hypothetical protein